MFNIAHQQGFFIHGFTDDLQLYRFTDDLQLNLQLNHISTVCLVTVAPALSARSVPASSAELIGKLDGVMRSAARLILKRQRFDHISTLMRNQLHWLDITARIKYKMCVFAFRCLQNTAPRYLSDYCIPVATLSGRSHLRSVASGSLLVPACRTVTSGPRAFAVA